MSQIQSYSTLFSTIYDEQAPVGNLGRGTHYSVLRSVEWLDVERHPLTKPQIHDFSIVWDEDHDIRVVPVIEKLYMEGLLSPIQFIGERKGGLTAIVAARYYFSDTEQTVFDYKGKVDSISQGKEDCWPAEIGSFDRAPGSEHQCFSEGLINDSDHKVLTYLKNIDSLWNLGMKNYQVN